MHEGRGRAGDYLRPLKHKRGVPDAAHREGGECQHGGRDHDREFAARDPRAPTVASDAPEGEDAGGEGRENCELRHVDGRTQVRRQESPGPGGLTKPFAGIPSNSPSAGEGKNLRTITPNKARSIVRAVVRAPTPVRSSAKRRAISRGDPNRSITRRSASRAGTPLSRSCRTPSRR